MAEGAEANRTRCTHSQRPVISVSSCSCWADPHPCAELGRLLAVRRMELQIRYTDAALVADSHHLQVPKAERGCAYPSFRAQEQGVAAKGEPLARQLLNPRWKGG
jgi:hypothetical protein